MEYRFFSQIEYRKFIRNLPSVVRFETRSKPYEIPVILFVDMVENMYL